MVESERWQGAEREAEALGVNKKGVWVSKRFERNYLESGLKLFECFIIFIVLRIKKNNFKLRKVYIMVGT